jgi:MerR family transcriptional regulator, redox-sensitive transcriptional activator SoxR
LKSRPIGSFVLRIGEVAAQSGFSTSAIRYYESTGVLPEPERVAGHRRYDPAVLQKLTAIEVAQRAGFSLGEIRLLLSAAETETVSAQLQELASRKLGDVEALIEQAEAMKIWLQSAKACECPTLDACALFDTDGGVAAPS